MIRLLALMISLALPITAGSAHAREGDAPQVPATFPGFLMQESEYYRAMTEYLRSLHQAQIHGNRAAADSSLAGIVRALESGADAHLTADWLWRHRQVIEWGDSSGSTHEATIRSLLASRRAGDALYLLNGADPLLPGYRHTPNHQLYLGVAFVQSGIYGRANESFSSVHRDHPDYERLSAYARLADLGPKIPHRSPTLAALLSIVPGAGYVYAGHTQTGIASFIVNGVLIGATIEAFRQDQETLGAFLSIFTFSWYTSSMIGSGKAAIRFNEHKKSEFVAQFVF